MSFTMTRTISESFTLTHAKYLASKVTTDLWRCRQIYGTPSESDINDYGTELAILLRDGYVSTYEFGFQSDNQRILTWRYIIQDSDLSASDDRPGGIVSGVDISKANFFNRLCYSSKWFNLSDEERKTIRETLPVQRVTKDGPKDGLGYWHQDRQYSSNGVSLPRSTFRPYPKP